jgi:hypothetical protein
MTHTSQVKKKFTPPGNLGNRRLIFAQHRPEIKSIPHRYRMAPLSFLFLLTFSFANATTNGNSPYPQQALQCYASSALNSQKDGVIICPPDRSNYCCKELVNATSRNDCGTVPGIYFGRDVWDRKVSILNMDFNTRFQGLGALTLFCSSNFFTSSHSAFIESAAPLPLHSKMTKIEFLVEKKKA